MDCCLFYGRPGFSFATLPSGTYRRPFDFGLRIDRRPLFVLASASGSSARKCEFGSLNAPLEPRTPAGRFLSGVLLDDLGNFQFAAREQLEMLAAEKDEADARMRLSLGSDEASLHRRIAELKRDECQAVVEDVMYMLIYHKFSEIGVYLVPRISQCVYNGRLEIWPSRDWELESIHSIEAVEMVREHLNDVGCRANSNVTESWAITEIERLHLCKLYTASVLYGYFLKSTSLRHGLEWGLYRSNFSIGDCTCVPVPETFSLEPKLTAFGHSSNLRSASVGQVSYGPVNKPKNLKRYLMGFDKETIQMCAKPKSAEAVNLIERYTRALFGDKKTGLLESDEIISTSFASMKRFVLEAVAFGSFLLEAENCVNAVYTLEEN